MKLRKFGFGRAEDGYEYDYDVCSGISKNHHKWLIFADFKISTETLILIISSTAKFALVSPLTKELFSEWITLAILNKMYVNVLFSFKKRYAVVMRYVCSIRNFIEMKTEKQVQTVRLCRKVLFSISLMKQRTKKKKKFVFIFFFFASLLWSTLFELRVLYI